MKKFKILLLGLLMFIMGGCYTIVETVNTDDPYVDTYIQEDPNVYINIVYEPYAPYYAVYPWYSYSWYYVWGISYYPYCYNYYWYYYPYYYRYPYSYYSYYNHYWYNYPGYYFQESYGYRNSNVQKIRNNSGYRNYSDIDGTKVKETRAPIKTGKVYYTPPVKQPDVYKTRTYKQSQVNKTRTYKSTDTRNKTYRPSNTNKTYKQPNTNRSKTNNSSSGNSGTKTRNIK